MIQVSFIIPVKTVTGDLVSTVQMIRQYLSTRYPERFEILIVPNPGLASPDFSGETLLEFQRNFSEVRICPPALQVGKGAAIRQGVLQSQGSLIFFTDADLPYRLEFFDRATEKLSDGYDFVSGNRRSAQSYFEIPVDLLKVAYKRHRLGLFFNSFIRFLLGIKTSDTQAGIKALTRRFAENAFDLQSCPGFYFDLELFLVSSINGYRWIELPVDLSLRSEKSTVRVLRESYLAVIWIVRISVRRLAGRYRVAASQR